MVADFVVEGGVEETKRDSVSEIDKAVWEKTSEEFNAGWLLGLVHDQ